MINDINEEMYKKIAENRTMSEEEARKTAQMVALSMKYGDLSIRLQRIMCLMWKDLSLLREIQDRTIYIRLCVSNQFLQNMQKVEKMQPSAR